MTRLRLTRPAGGAAIALTLAVVWAALAAAAPAAAAHPTAATPPTRVLVPLGGFMLPAGSACSFDVEGQPSSGFSAKTVFSDGRQMYSVHAKGAYVNVATGAGLETRDIFTDMQRFDPTTGIVTAVDSGQSTYGYLPGDLGPFGLVGSHGALYHFVGTVHYTWDTNTNETNVLAYSGTVTDVCAALG